MKPMLSKKLIVSGSIVSLVFVAIGIGFTILTNNYVVRSCQDESTSLGTFVTDLLNQTITIPPIDFNISTSNLPSSILFNQTVQTQFGPVDVNASIPLNLPPFITGATANIDLVVTQLVGQNALGLVLSSSQVVGNICGYISVAIYVFGTVATITLVWLTILSFAIAAQ